MVTMKVPVDQVDDPPDNDNSGDSDQPITNNSNDRLAPPKTPPTCVNLQDRHGRTPLHAAVAGGHLQTVKCLIKNGADVDIKAESGLDKGRTPLHISALSGSHPETAQFLLSHGACVNTQDAQGHSPLHLAAMEGRMELVVCLIEAGANCDLQDAGGKTPLHTCFVEEGPSPLQREVALVLVPNCNLCLVDRRGRLALHLASLWNCGEVIELMVTRDVDINTRDSEGNTPLHYAFLNEAKINMEAASILLGHGVDLQLTDGNRRSPIHALMKHRRSSDPEVKEMVRKWAELRLSAEFGGSLLHLASIGGNTDVARFLLACGVDSNIADNQGRCPLHLAAIGGRLDLLRVLMKNTAEVNLQDSEGATPIHYAAELQRMTAIKMLLHDGARLDIRDNQGQVPLHHAAEWGSLDTVKHLVAVNCDLHTQTNEGLQPLHLAAKHDQVEVAEFLMSKGVAVQAEDPEGRTPLHLASTEGHCDLIKALYVNGADINKTDNNGRTSLHYACGKGHSSAVQTLLNRGGNATIRDLNGKRPEDLITENKHESVLHVLRQFRKSYSLYAQEQLPLVTDTPEELYEKYTLKHNNPRLNCLRPLTSVETLPDEEEFDDMGRTDRLSEVREDNDNNEDNEGGSFKDDGETIKLLEATVVSEPQYEVTLHPVIDNDKNTGPNIQGNSRCTQCCIIS